MNNKTIAITANTCWYIFNFRSNTIKALIKNGYCVVACAPRDDYTNNLIDLGCVYGEIRIDRRGKNPLNEIVTIYDFYKCFKKYDVNLTLNFTPKNNIYATLAAKIINIKVVNNIAGLGTSFINKGFVNFIVKNLYKTTQKKADFVFFQNREDEKIFDDLGIEIKNKDVLPGSGVDLDRFEVVISPNDGIVRFILVARMLVDKGIYQFVECARILTQKFPSLVEFNLLGFIDESNERSISKAQMDSWVNEGIINYLGVSDRVETIIGSMDCVVLPSFYREGVPRSLLEAAAMGKPIITTDNVGCRETVNDTVTGFICKPRSVDDLCEKLELMLSLNHIERAEMGLAGRRRVEDLFNEKIVIDKYLMVVNQLIKHKF